MPKEPQEITNAALYARVSSDRQDIDLSVSAQLRALRDYARKNKFLITREFVDEAESGRIADRPQFRRMIDEGSKSDSPFNVILVWKFSRFTRKREHAVAFKSMLRRKGIRVVSITEHADDSPTGKLMEAIIESVDEFYSENLGQEVIRGMRESASRGFWVAPHPPLGYRRLYVQDGPRKRPRLELDPPNDSLVRRIFEMVLSGNSMLEIAKAFNAEGLRTVRGNKWRNTTVYNIVQNEAYTGTLIWGNTKDGAKPVRVENAFPAIISSENFERVQKFVKSRSPKIIHPRRLTSSYLLSGLARCGTCDKALTAAGAHSGKYTYYVCQSLIKKGKGTCNTPRLNARQFEQLIIDNLRENVLTESNINGLVKLLDEEMDGEARENRGKLEAYTQELEDVKRRLDRIWHVIETTDIDMADASERVLELRDRREFLEQAMEEESELLAERRKFLDRVDTIQRYAVEMREFLRTSDLTETRSFIRSFVQQISVTPSKAVIDYTIPMPEDAPEGAAESAELALNMPFIPATQIGQPFFYRTANVPA